MKPNVGCNEIESIIVSCRNVCLVRNKVRRGRRNKKSRASIGV